MSLNSYTLYVFVRQDISLEDQLVQANHAIFKMCSEHLFVGEEGTPRIVCVGLPDARALNRVVQKLEGLDFPFTVYSDPDFPQLGTTAISTAPLTENQRASLRNYRLYRSAATTFIPLVAGSGAGTKGLPQSCGGSKPEGEPNLPAFIAQSAILQRFEK